MFTFRRAQISAVDTIGADVERTRDGMPLDMAQRAWGADRYLSALGLEASAQTGRHTSRPFIAAFRSYPGVQLRNGVQQMDPHWEIPNIPGALVPYWQITARANPPSYLHGGGAPYPPQGPYQVAQMTAPTPAANVAASTYGYLATSSGS